MNQRTMVGVTLDDKLVSWINENKGIVSRSRFVEKMILDGIQTKKIKIKRIE